MLKYTQMEYSVEYLLKENMGKFAIATEQKYLFNV